MRVSGGGGEGHHWNEGMEEEFQTNNPHKLSDNNITNNNNDNNSNSYIRLFNKISYVTKKLKN